MSTSAALGVVGGVIGFYFGGPTGAQIGFAIGSAVGGAIDPEQIPGTKINDGNFQGSTSGLPRALVFGDIPVIGAILDAGPMRVVKEKESAGKGGPEVVNEVAYLDYAIEICESSELKNSTVTAIVAVWEDEKLVYDVRPSPRISAADSAKWKEGVTFYYGGESQMPDPTLEQIHGVGNVNAHRGTCYSMFRNRNISQYGQRIPVYKWLVSSTDTLVQGECSARGRFFAGNTVDDLFYSDSGDAWSGDQIDPGVQSSNVSTANAAVFVTSTSGNRVSFGNGATWQSVTGLPTSSSCFGFIYAEGQYYATYNGDGNLYKSPDGLTFTSTALPSAAKSAPCFGAGVLLVGQVFGNVSRSDDFGVSFTTVDVGGSDNDVQHIAFSTAGFVAFKTMASQVRISEDGSTGTWAGHAHALQGVTINAAAGVADSGSLLVVVAIGGDTMSSDDGGLTWALGADVPFNVSGGTGSHIAFSTGPDNDNPLFVIAGDDGKLAAGTDATAWTPVFTAASGTDFTSIAALDFYSDGRVAIPDAPGWYVLPDGTYVGDCDGDVAEPGTPVSIATIVTRLDQRCQVDASKIDVTQLVPLTTRGFKVQRVTTASDAQETLRRTYFFDAPEYDDKIRYTLRGANIAITVDPDDLIEDGGSVDDDGEGVTHATQAGARGQQVEFPRLLHLSYLDVDLDYVQTTQTAERRSPDIRVVGEAGIEAALSMTKDEAAQNADKMLKVMWAEAAGRKKFAVPHEYLEMVPSTVFALDGRRWRVDAMRIEDGAIYIEHAPHDRQSAYTSNVEGVPGVTPEPPGSSLNGPTALAIMNAPILRDQDDQIGVYAAVAGLLPSWQGCTLQYKRATDAEWTTAVQSMTVASTMGYLVDPLPSASRYAIDTTNTLHVKLYTGGELDSITFDQLIAEGNPFAIMKADGTTEIVQGQDATEIAALEYEITTLTRGRLDTTPATHAAGAVFVALDGFYFIPLPAHLIGVAMLWRAVGFGSLADNNPEIPFTFNPAVSQTEWAPYMLTSSIDGSDNIAMRWIGRGRLGNSLLPYHSTFFDEYRLTFTDGADSFSYTTTAQSFTYTAAQQTADFGGIPSALDVSIVAMNRITGASAALTGTLI